MIPNQWYVVLDAKEVGKKPLGVKRFGERMVFWRDSRGEVVCQRDKCCHRGAQLSLGQVLGDCIECPFHGWQFDQEGACTLVPSNGKNAKIPKKFRVKSYPVREEYGWIWVYYGEVEEGQELPPIEYFASLQDPAFGTATFQDEWPVHYTRSIENQLDVTHLAFTHKNTIGDPTRPVIDGPLFKWMDDKTIRFYPISAKDEGQVARQAKEITTEELKKQGFLEFRFPNTWMLHITDKFMNAAAFVPVDETTSITYVRLYQKFIRVPVLKSIVTSLMGWFNKRVLAEDRPMVLSQDPIRSELEMDELLVPGDRPIVEYRRRRDELLRAAQTGQEVRSLEGKTNAAHPDIVPHPYTTTQAPPKTQSDKEAPASAH